MPQTVSISTAICVKFPGTFSNAIPLNAKMFWAIFLLIPQTPAAPVWSPPTEMLVSCPGTWLKDCADAHMGITLHNKTKVGPKKTRISLFLQFETDGPGDAKLRLAFCRSRVHGTS